MENSPKAVIRERGSIKGLSSPDYHYVFNKITGAFARWGQTQDQDPIWSPFGPEIADIEISTICHGIQGNLCRFCYKKSTGKGRNMSLKNFKTIFSKFPPTLTQIAFGIGDIDANPDLWDIFQHCRENGVIPNVTINGDRMDAERYDKLVELCGAVAVSRYKPKDVCYNAVQELSSRGLWQVNIHMLLSQETYEDCLELIDDIRQDSRLRSLNAVVFLALKPRGRGVKMTPMRDTEAYKRLVEKAFDANVRIGFDSCSAPTFLKSMESHEHYKRFEQCSEPCESTLFSIYVDVRGNVWPCSFLEHEEYDPVNLLFVDDFIKQCWQSDRLQKFRKDLLDTQESPNALVRGVRQCPKYDLY